MKKKKQLKIYNPLLLDTEKDLPTFNRGPFNWWLINASPSKRFLCYFVQQKDIDFNRHYVIVDEKEKTIVHTGSSLESALLHIDILERANRRDWI